MKNYLQNLFIWIPCLLSILVTLGSCQEEDDLPQENQKISEQEIKRQILTNKQIMDKSNVYSAIKSLQSSIYNRNGEDNYNVNLDDVLYLSDGEINSYTFGVSSQDPNEKLNILINEINGEISSSIIDYSLSIDEIEELTNGEVDGLENAGVLIPIENDQVNFTSRGFDATPEVTNYCIVRFVHVDTMPCSCHEVHNSNGCTHPTDVYEMEIVACFGGGGGPSGPSGPGSSNGGGSSSSSGSPDGYTDFVITDGGTGSQDDVDALNQMTQQMDAAFGIGNWGYLNNPSDEVPTFNSIQEYLDYQLEVKNSFINISVSNQSNTDGTHITKYKSKFEYIPLYMNIEVKSILDDINTTNNNEFELLEVSSYTTGVSPFVEWVPTTDSYSLNSNSVTVYINGYFNEGVKIGDYGIYTKESYSFYVTLNKFTGAATSPITIID